MKGVQQQHHLDIRLFELYTIDNVFSESWYNKMLVLLLITRYLKNSYLVNFHLLSGQLKKLRSKAQ